MDVLFPLKRWHVRPARATGRGGITRRRRPGVNSTAESAAPPDRITGAWQQNMYRIGFAGLPAKSTNSLIGVEVRRAGRRRIGWTICSDSWGRGEVFQNSTLAGADSGYVSSVRFGI